MAVQSPLINLPYFILPNRLVYFPGVTYQTGLSKSDSKQIAAHFDDKLNEIDGQLAGQVEKLLCGRTDRGQENTVTTNQNTLRSYLPGNALFIACIPNVENTENGNVSATITRITSIQEYNNQYVISFTALFRARTKIIIHPKITPRHGVSTFSINRSELVSKQEGLTEDKLEIISSITTKALQALKSIHSFNGRYAEFKKAAQHKTFNEKLQKIILRLTPLAFLMNSELSGKEVDMQLRKLAELYEKMRINKKVTTSHLKTLSQLNDAFVAVFPYSFHQKVFFLGEWDTSKRAVIFEKYLEFADFLLNKQLDMKHVAEQWSDMRQRLSPDEFKTREMQFITTHLQSLKQIIRLYDSSDKKGGSALGSATDPQSEKLNEFIAHLDGLLISPDGKRMIEADYNRMKHMPQSGSEYQVLRTYMDVIMDIPWQGLHAKNKPPQIDLNSAWKQLDSDHYGMERAKERIVEYLAVLKMHVRIKHERDLEMERQASKQKKVKTGDSLISIGGGDTLHSDDGCGRAVSETCTRFSAPILLLTGPPGVGKTSLARSVAQTLGRKFQRVSLGGLNDFADLKGHRRTYVGAIPGLIVQALRRAQTYNPVILLDEIDKVAGATRNGNPEAALLEILDPEQNKNFQDHYVGFPIDLSQVVFICTANNLWDISAPLRDRMERIELNGYSYLEKVEICKRYLIPRQMERNCLASGALHLDDDTILKIATEYTNEPGIRSLERNIASICRIKAIEYEKLRETKTAKRFLPNVDTDDLPKYIGTSRIYGNSGYGNRSNLIQEQYGVANGLSYNSDGSGSLLSFEMVGLPGDKSLSCTGSLGDVLLESARIADVLVGYMLNKRILVSDDNSLDIEAALDRYRNTEVHLHVPEGAISKDGPSAGITITICLLSLILQMPIPNDLAMTGEITLTGKILPIGGLKEKLLGAHLSGRISRVIVPLSLIHI